MQNLDSRIRKLEGWLGDPTAAKLYDRNGDLVSGAKVMKWPTKTTRGMALMPDGTTMEIAETVTTKEVLHARAHREIDTSVEPVSEEKSEPVEDVLFLRVDGDRCFAEFAWECSKKRSGDL